MEQINQEEVVLKSGQVKASKKNSFIFTKIFLITIAFFWITGGIFPQALYPTGSSVGRILASQALNPQGTEIISNSDIILTGIKAFLPWVEMSPWLILNPVGRCEIVGCLPTLFGNVPIFYIPVFIGLFILYYKLLAIIVKNIKKQDDLTDLNKTIFKGIIACWIIIMAFGAYISYKNYVNPIIRLNGILSQLENASGKNPFPLRTVTGFNDVITNTGSKFGGLLNYWNQKPQRSLANDHEVTFNVYYQNPNFPTEEYAVNVYLFKSPYQLPLDEKLAWCQERMARASSPAVLREVGAGIWRCSGNDLFFEFGFLDKEHKIFAEMPSAVNIKYSPAKEEVSGFFAYYR